MASADRSPFHIFGAGPSGSLAALALAHRGNTVVLTDPLDGSALQSRSRAYAITHSSRRLLQTLDLWTALRPALTPFHRLALRDEASRSYVLFQCRDLDPASRTHEAIGWILDHSALMNVLLARLRSDPRVSLYLGRSAPTPPTQSVIVAADGPRSAARTQWGIGTWGYRYRQGCLTAKVALRGTVPGQAYELFRPEGPLAVLPLPDGCFQVVWSAPMEHCIDRSHLSEPVFLDHLASVLPDGIQPDLLLDQPTAFPQQWMLAHRLSSSVGVLIGESAHRCHPVGGQGLNLCWRDVDTLSKLSEQANSPQQLARRYGRRRWMDVVLVNLTTDLLVRLFSNRLFPLLPLRWMALQTLAGWPLFRRLILRAMTDGPMRMLRPAPN